MAIVYKMIPHILASFGIALVMFRGFSGRRSVVALTSIAGFVAGAAGAVVLFRVYRGTIPFGVIKTALGSGFLILWGVAVGVMYRSTGRGTAFIGGERFVDSSYYAGICTVISSMVAGAICMSRLPVADSSVLKVAVFVFGGGVLACGVVFAAKILEKRLPAAVTVTQSGMLAAVMAFLLMSSSSTLRLDLFSPLSMKVMKGIHDFVHQFMESILIPDHLFVQPVVWKYIGYLFGKGVGFWGGMIIWFTPVLLIVLANQLERLPSVAHVRQGAQRRKLIFAAIEARRFRLVIPMFSVIVFAAAAYQSSFPSVEYWDPKPVPVTANQAGEIFIPKQGEINLEDGKLHKFLFKQGGREAKFFVLMTPAGKLTVVLDACAICKPDGYGQAEGSVICYYCITLIPLETVGKPGGCNPVPISFTEKADGVIIDGMTLVNTWGATVQSTARVKEGGK